MNEVYPRTISRPCIEPCPCSRPEGCKATCKTRRQQSYLGCDVCGKSLGYDRRYVHFMHSGEKLAHLSCFTAVQCGSTSLT